MRPARSRAGRVLPALGCLIIGAGGLLRAQERTPTADITWEAATTREGWCVEFLMEPKEAVGDLTRGYRVTAARDSRSLLPGISRLIADEPTYADWIPSEVCIYIADAITLDNRRYDRGDGGQPVAVIYWGVAAAREDGSAAGDELVSFRSFGTNSSALQQRMGNLGVPIDRIEFQVQPMADSPDQNYLVKLAGAQMTYSAGPPRPDSTATAGEQVQTGVFNGNNRAVWTTRLVFEPEAIGLSSGALRVVGKHGLAKALNRSPIRLVGPALVGGPAKVSMTR